MNWLKRMLAVRAAPVPADAAEADDPDRWLRAGYDCESRGDLAGADRGYRKVLELHPANVDALYFLGRIAARDRRNEEALELFRKAAELDPRNVIHLWALGVALHSAKLFDESAEVFRSCVALQPDCADLRNCHAASLIELGRREEARVELEWLRGTQSDAPFVDFNLGGIYREYGWVDKAIAAYRRAVALTPDYDVARDNLLLTLNYSPDLDAAAIFAEHRRFGEHFARRFTAPSHDASAARRLRVGYVSPDFRNHVVSFFFWPIIVNHDRSRFEIFCYHSHPKKDRYTEALRSLADHWRDCEELSNVELADRIRADRIDILVDLAGHTDSNRLLAFALKPAPIQATYLGYPNTTGLGAVDYRITDAFADPPGDSDRLSAERLVRLPVTYFCYRPPLDAPAVGRLPASTAGVITFGCFNNITKISRPFLDCAARVLSAVPGSRLVLKGRPVLVPDVAQAIRDRFQRAGVSAERIELRDWEPTSLGHLGAYGSVDIALDSFPYNGATTTCEALWMGVPVVTLVGDRHAGRCGSSLLNAVGLGEYVARDIDEYVSITASLARDVVRLAELRGGLRDRMHRSPLMDEARLTRALEQAYLQMWQDRIQSGAGLPPPAAESAAELLERARRLRATGKTADAEDLCRRILSDHPAHAEALALLWDLGYDAGTPGSAIDCLVRAMEIDGSVASFHYMLGCSFHSQGKAGEAIAEFRRALALDPVHAKLHNNLGCALELTGDLVGAAQCFEEAARLDPGLVQAIYNLGNVCKQLGDATRAARLIEQALAHDPAHADWRCNLGSLHYDQLRLDDAIENFRAALAVDPGYLQAYSGLGSALLLCGRIEEAAAAFQKALELNPAQPDLDSWLLLLMHYRQGEDGQTLFEKHRAWADRHARTLMRATSHSRTSRRAPRRLNIGYLSPDFMQHPAASFIEPVLAAHDRGEVGIFCYSNAGREDAVTRRLRGLCENWRDISGVSDDSVADRMRADGIDILVDLAGHTGGGRLRLLAARPAPAQVTWLGYPNTTGLAEVNYRLTDAVADPVGETEKFHSEKLVRLAKGFLCYLPHPDSPAIAASQPGAAGQVTFACFNNLAKVTPQMIELWAELLRSLPESRMMLKAYGFGAGSARREVLDRFIRHGIAAERIDIRAPEVSVGRHLATYHEVDIALDVFPYNGTTTSCEALWMGVPVVTLAGRTHVSRVGASILNSAGFSRFVAGSPEQYRDIASQLALDVDGRRNLRAGMRDRLKSSALLDAAGFARELEAAYRAMWTEIAAVAADLQ